MDALALCRTHADGILCALAANPAYELALMSDKSEWSLRAGEIDWEIVAIRFTGKEILHTAQSLVEGILILALVSDKQSIMLRICDSMTFTAVSFRLADLADFFRTKIISPTGSAIAEMLQKTASCHGRLSLIAEANAALLAQEPIA